MPHDDDALRARIEAEPDAPLDDDPRWDRLAAGLLSSDEHLALSAKAEDSELVAQLLAALQPDPEAQEAALSVAQTSFHEASASSWARGWRWLGVGVALAAALLLVVLVSPSRPPAPVPDYAATWRAGSRGLRSTPADPRPDPTDAPPTLATEDVVELRLIPATDPGGPLQVRVAIDAWSHPLTEGVSINLRGVVVVRGRIGQGAWDLPSGAHDVLIRIGREGSQDARSSVHPFLVR